MKNKKINLGLKISKELGVSAKILVGTILAVSLTACGGGGGGSSSSPATNTSSVNKGNENLVIVNPVNVNKKIEEVGRERILPVEKQYETNISSKNITKVGKFDGGDFKNSIGIYVEAGEGKETQYINAKGTTIKMEVQGRSEEKKNEEAYITGMFMDNNFKDELRGKLVNNGNIEIKGDENTFAKGMAGSYTNLENNGNIKVSSNRGSGMEGYYSKMVNGETGKIEVSVGMTGMEALWNKAEAINRGKIIVNSEDIRKERGESIGISGHNVVENSSLTIMNDRTGKIDVKGKWIYGMYGTLGSNEKDDVKQNGEVNVINDGEISIFGVAGSGIRGEILEFRENSGNEIINVVNNGTINTNGEQLTGMEGSIINSLGKPITKGTRILELTNNNMINIKGDFSSGMSVRGDGAKAVNNGTINVDGDFSYGMVVQGKGAVAINKGVINVTGQESYGMASFDGGKLINEKSAKIVVDSKESAFVSYKDSFPGETIKGDVLNKGEIIIRNNNVKVAGAYAMGINANGGHGMLFAKNVIIDEDVKLSIEMEPKAMFTSRDKEVVMAEGEKIEVSDKTEIKTNSIIHRVELKKEKTPTNEELRARIIQEAKLADYTDEQIKEIAKLFDSYIDDQESYQAVVLASPLEGTVVNNDPLSEIAKKLDSKERLNAILDRFAGIEYLNLPRQILNINENFGKYDSSVISSLGESTYNFEFIGENSKDNSKKGINGYKTQMTGFNGVIRLRKDIYGVAGYGYSDIDYKNSSSSEKIETIHTGLYKDMKMNEYNLRIGVLGEYNFHKMDRESVDKTANSKFNSYTVGTKFEANRRFGSKTYIEPIVGLNISYGNREEFKETGAESYNLKIQKEDYTSIKPEIGVKTGRIFKNIQVFGKAKYSYEFGDIDKDMNVELLNKKAKVKNNDMEEGKFYISTGMMVNFKDFRLNFEIGKEFKDVNKFYITTGIGYTF